jgi:tRNA modification GTPase
MNSDDTIYAISSGQGRAGIAVVRFSGTACLPLVKALTGLTPTPRHAHLVDVVDPLSGDVIDRCMILSFPGPASVTGEDVVEFHLHGSAAIANKLFETARRAARVRPAEPGEFTRRAFVNGKLDLVEVEGLADLLAAQSEPQRRLAIRHFLGTASDVYEGWRRKLLAAIGLIEASIDFSDEDDVATVAITKVMGEIEGLLVDLEEALRKSSRGQLVRAGIRLVIAGPPNAGKSTLMNHLAARNVAIVSPVAGTTRDVIEVPVQLSGLPVVLVDTAGLREGAHDVVEIEGINRAHQELRDADILVWVTAPDVDCGVLPGRTPDAIVFNKLDLSPETLIQVRNDWLPVSVLGVSLKTNEGFNELLQFLESLMRDRCGNVDDVVIVRERHAVAVGHTVDILRAILANPGEPEILADNMRRAATYMTAITGRVEVEDFLGHIFAEFCIGK